MKLRNFRTKMVVASSQLDLDSLPLVIQRIIMDHLPLNDLLNLRFVSHSISSWISGDYFQRRLSHKRIYIKNITQLKHFTSTAINLPFTKFNFGFCPKINSSLKTNRKRRRRLRWPEIPAVYYIDYNSQPMKTFRLNFGNKITHLTVGTMYMCKSKAEFAFYESLTCLKSLHITAADHRKNFHKLGFEERKRILESTRIPPNLHSLTELYLESSPHSYTFHLLKNCPNLLKISLGLTYSGESSFELLINEFFVGLLQFLRDRLKTIGKNQFELNLWSFQTKDHYDSLTDENLKELADVMKSPQLRINGLHGYFFDLLDRNGITRSQIGGVVNNLLSIGGLPRVIYGADHLKLLRVNLKVDCRPNIDDVQMDKDQPNLPQALPAPVTFYKANGNWYWKSVEEINLKIQPTESETRGGGLRDALEAMREEEIDLRDIVVPLDVSKRDAIAVSNLILGNSQNPNQSRVRKINFVLKKGIPGIFVIPEDLCCNFPNLTDLKLAVQTFVSADYTHLFSLLGKDTRIKSLRITSEIGFSDETFMGTDGEESPSPFGTLKHLQIFELTSSRRTRVYDCNIIYIILFRQFLLTRIDWAAPHKFSSLCVLKNFTLSKL